MSTEILKGTATAVRYTLQVSGNNTLVSTRHYTLFRLGRTPVMFVSATPAAIAEGDQLIVAGRRKGQLLRADAYFNETTQLRGDAGRWRDFAGTLLFLGVAVGALLGGLLLSLYAPEKLPLWLALAGVISLFSGGVGLYCLRRWRRIRRAVLQLQGGADASLRLETTRN